MSRVAVTTTQATAGPVAAAVAGVGLEPVLLPCIEVVPVGEDVLEELRRRAAEADLVVVTSAWAVAIVWPDGGMPSTPVAAVGPATARAVEEAGGAPAVTGDAGAAGLVVKLEVAGKSVVFPHARGADPATLTDLIARGAEVFAPVVYDTKPVAPGPEPVEAVLFGSPSALAGWTLSRELSGLVVGAIGATTAEAARRAGVDDPVVPSAPGYEALAREIAVRMTR